MVSSCFNGILLLKGEHVKPQAIKPDIRKDFRGFGIIIDVGRSLTSPIGELAALARSGNARYLLQPAFAQADEMNSLFKFLIKQAVVRYYNGVAYIDQ